MTFPDTHVPVRARDLPPEVWAAVDDADVVLHAGDRVSEALLDALRDDGPALRARLPEVHRLPAGSRWSPAGVTGVRGSPRRRSST